mgnify:CR=1 FL=1
MAKKKEQWEDYWLCDGCSKEFKSKSETREHEKNCQQYIESKNLMERKEQWEVYWVCEGCRKEFKSESETIEHEKNCQQYLESKKLVERKKNTVFEEPERSIAAIPTFDED